ncbi:pectate lyase [Massilia horti]|uniref:Pectate lyase n=1 Tax=Massilia horti TaxID=2562153 RepID=A0A4Y9TBB3_9BURK|nr:pectate lyase [Massilia horti]TFW36182.1 pectate lyase [Massilia horti]
MMKHLKKARSVLFALAGLALAANVHAAPAKRAVPACTKVTVTGSTTVAAGTTWDGLAKYGKWVCMVGSGTKMDGSQSESQDPHFILNEGATLKNVIIGDPSMGTGRNLLAGGADGVHCKGNCRIENVYWGDVGEDAATMESSAPSGSVMTVVGGAAYKANDKIFQNNGNKTRISISDFYAEEAGKLYRSCGNCSSQYVRYATVNGVTLYNVGTGLGVNSSFDSAKLPGLAGQYDVADMTDFVSNSSSSRCVGYVGTAKGYEPVKDTNSSNVARSCKFH